MTESRSDEKLAARLHKLGDNLREEGVEPARDLWPEIDAALDKKTQRPRWPLLDERWRYPALAAVLVLALGLGYLNAKGPQEAGEGFSESVLAVADEGLSTDDPSALQALDQTLGQLNDAMSQDPGNVNLSRFVRLVHRSRAEVLRQRPADRAGLNI